MIATRGDETAGSAKGQAHDRGSADRVGRRGRATSRWFSSLRSRRKVASNEVPVGALSCTFVQGFSTMAYLVVVVAPHPKHCGQSGSSASATSPATATAWVSIVRRFANGFGNRFRTGFSITSAASPQPRGDANAFIGAQFMTELGELRYRESNKVYFAGVRIRACTHKS